MMKGVSFSCTIWADRPIFVHRILLDPILGSKCQKTSYMSHKSFLFIALWMADLLPDEG
jgi:hypothetical protein